MRSSADSKVDMIGQPSSNEAGATRGKRGAKKRARISTIWCTGTTLVVNHCAVSELEGVSTRYALTNNLPSCVDGSEVCH